MKIVTVLRSGGEYLPQHVKAIQRQVQKYAPWADFQCLSDVYLPDVDVIQMRHLWPGWWAKMELFGPHVKGDILYTDLDTVFVGSLDDILQVKDLTLLRDFYRDGVKLKAGLGSSLMCLPEEKRARIWERFSENPQMHMRVHRSGGDQRFLETMMDIDGPCWQDRCPGQVVSYKVHCAEHLLGKGFVFRSIPVTARVVCFHGQPRPFAVPEFKDLYQW